VWRSTRPTQTDRRSRNSSRSTVPFCRTSGRVGTWDRRPKPSSVESRHLSAPKCRSPSTQHPTLRLVAAAVRPAPGCLPPDAPDRIHSRPLSFPAPSIYWSSSRTAQDPAHKAWPASPRAGDAFLKCTCDLNSPCRLGHGPSTENLSHARQDRCARSPGSSSSISKTLPRSWQPSRPTPSNSAYASRLAPFIIHAFAPTVA
jgi:hypothetical protein